MALRMAMDLRAGRLFADPGNSSPPPPSLHPVALGIVLSLSNPYWILWWATIGLAMLTPAIDQGWPAVASVYAGHISADLAWYGAVSAAVAGGRRVMPTAARRAVAASSFIQPCK
jgi:threonine/homoserine/homoserine lactone efflux protein